MVEPMRGAGLGIFVVPQGTFYVFTDASRFTEDSCKFAFELLEKASWALSLPGDGLVRSPPAVRPERWPLKKPRRNRKPWRRRPKGRARAGSYRSTDAWVSESGIDATARGRFAIIRSRGEYGSPGKGVPMADTCKSLPGSAVTTIVLAFDLVGYEAKSAPAQILRVLDSKKVQEAIRNALNEDAKAFLKQQQEGLPIGAGQAASQIGTSVGKALLSTGVNELQQEIQRTAAYRRLESGVRDLQCAYEKSVIGVWVDEHKALLIVIASGVVLGAMTAMYLTNTGDTPADWAAQLAKNKLKTTILGKVEVGVSDIKFVPSKREIGLQVYADTSKWKRFKESKFSVTVHTKDEKLTSLKMTFDTRSPLGGGFYQTLGASADPIAKNYSFALGIQGESGGLRLRILAEVAKEAEKTRVGGSAALSYQGKVGPVPLNLTATAGINKVTGPGAGPGSSISRTDARVQIGLSIPFDFLP